MQIILEGSNARYTLEQLAQTLFAGEDLRIRCFVRESDTRINAACEVTRGAEHARASAWAEKTADEYARNHAHRLAVARAFYRAALTLLGVPPAWGMLSGVRPAKLVRAQLAEGKTLTQARHYLEKTYFVSREKADLCVTAGNIAYQVQNSLASRDILLYIHIPFCPSRCSYCSFVSMSAGDWARYGTAYCAALERELDAFEQLVRKQQLHIRAVYIGGGTPAILEAEALRALCTRIRSLAPDAEFTVEAGRPDVITLEKLMALRDAAVDRVCVNPQTIHDRTLALIGRRHTGEDFFRAYELARQAGFSQINVDLIAGLPGETVEDFRTTLDSILPLEPENITVHTLAVKRSSFLNEAAHQTTAPEQLHAMLDYASAVLTANKYAPYYLYRQKNTGGSFENIGFSRSGQECLYNICMMEEIGNVVALGAGASTKLTDSGIVRRTNPKYPREYIESIDEILAEFEQLHTYFQKSKPRIVFPKGGSMPNAAYINHMPIDLINDRIRHEPEAFVHECEQAYFSKVDHAAETIARSADSTGIVLLAGPSSSGKTTTAHRITQRLRDYGIHTETVSMDDYFLSLDRNDDSIDFEVPERLDIELLNQHIAILAEGGEVRLPQYDFHTGLQSLSDRVVRRERDTVVIFEGLHALNDLFDHEGKEIRIYISPRMRVMRDGEVFLPPEALRFMRRSVRDIRFRNADFARTLSLWPNVIRGERRYVIPSKVNADIVIDTSMAYEPGLLALAVGTQLDQLDTDALRKVDLDGIAEKVRAFEKLPFSLIPEDSLMREFIGKEGLKL